MLEKLKQKDEEKKVLDEKIKKLSRMVVESSTLQERPKKRQKVCYPFFFSCSNVSQLESNLTPIFLPPFLVEL